MGTHSHAVLPARIPASPLALRNAAVFVHCQQSRRANLSAGVPQSPCESNARAVPVTMDAPLLRAQDLAPAEHKLSGNEYLRMASTFHSMHAIASQVRCRTARAVGSSTHPPLTRVTTSLHRPSALNTYRLRRRWDAAESSGWRLTHSRCSACKLKQVPAARCRRGAPSSAHFPQASSCLCWPRPAHRICQARCTIFMSCTLTMRSKCVNSARLPSRVRAPLCPLQPSVRASTAEPVLRAGDARALRAV